MIKLNDKSQKNPFGLTKFKKIMSEIDDCFEGSNGADASDLLRYIFSSLSSEDLNIDHVNDNINEQPLDETSEKETFNEFKKCISPSLINNIFYIYNKITFLCKNKHKNYCFEYSSFLEFNLMNISKQTMGKKGNLELITLNQCFIYNKNLLENNEDFECSVCEKSIWRK